jgi:hypothetical protein
MHQLTGAVTLEKGEGLTMDMGVKTSPQVVRGLLEHGGFDP